jgi:hypothetical protein
MDLDRTPTDLDDILDALDAPPPTRRKRSMTEFCEALDRGDAEGFRPAQRLEPLPAGDQTFCMGRRVRLVASTVRGSRSMASTAWATSSGWISRPAG